MRKSLVSLVALGLFIGAPAFVGTALAQTTTQQKTEQQTQQQHTQQQQSQQQATALSAEQFEQMLSQYEARSEVEAHIIRAITPTGERVLVLVGPRDMQPGASTRMQDTEARDRFQQGQFSDVAILGEPRVLRADLDEEHYIFALSADRIMRFGVETGGLTDETQTGTQAGTAMGQTGTGTDTQTGTAMGQSGTDTQTGTAMGQTGTGTDSQSTTAMDETGTGTDTQTGTAIGQTGTGTDSQSTTAMDETGTDTQTGTAMGETGTGTESQTGTAMGETDTGTAMGQTGTGMDSQSTTAMGETGTDTQTGTAMGETGTGTESQTGTAMGQTGTGTDTQTGTAMGETSTGMDSQSETTAEPDGQVGRAISEPGADDMVRNLEQAGLQDASEIQGRLVNATTENGAPVFFVIARKDMQSDAEVDVSEDEIRQKLEQSGLQDVRFIDDASIVRGNLEDDHVFVLAGDLFGQGRQQ